MNRLKKILESRFAGIFCFLFAIGNRIIFTSLYSTIGRDTNIQLTYAENLLGGHGLGTIKYFTTDLDTPVFDTNQRFAPGFSLAITPFLKLAHGDEYAAVLAFDIIAAILFMISVRWLGKKGGLSPASNNIVTLIAGCSQYDFFTSYSATDGIALAFLLLSLAATISLIERKERLSFGYLAVYGLLFFMPGFFRYMYLHFTLLFPFIIVIYGSFSKNQLLKNNGIRLFITATLFIILQIGFTYAHNGNVAHINEPDRGIFPHQVVHWYPFLPASFINLDFAAQLIARVSKFHYSDIFFLFEPINALLFALLIFLLIRYLRKMKRGTELSQQQIFIVTGSIIALSVLLLLAYLSLTYKMLGWAANKWSYCNETRYFAFIYVFIPLLFFSVFDFNKPVTKKPLLKSFFYLGLVCFLIEVSHGIYYNAKIVMRHPDLNSIRDGAKDYRSLPILLDSLKIKYPDREILVSSPDEFNFYKASQKKYKAIFDYVNLNKSDLRVTKKSLLVVPIHKADAWKLKEYVDVKKPILIKSGEETNFYLEEINPY